MKVLSLTQPLATLMALNEKRYETRSWRTPHRGPLAIAASKSFPRSCRALLKQEPFARVLARHGLTLADLLEQCGCIIAVVEVVACAQTTRIVAPTTSFDPCRVWPYARRMVRVDPAEHEFHFGDYSTGRFAWITTNVRRLARPVSARGRLGLWEFSDELILGQVEEVQP